MPIYEYYCQTCRKEMSIWFGSIAQAAAQQAVCADCGGQQLTRLISNVSVARAAPSSSDPPPSAGGARGESPLELAQAMRAASAGREVGQDFQEVAGRLEKGESATSVEASLRKRVGENMQAH